MHVFDLRDVETAALYFEIDRLTACHAETAARLGEQRDQLEAYGGRGGQRRVRREQLEGERLQPVADQNRRRLVVGLVAGGSAAAQIVIVHRRQIVVHERVHVHELDGARRTLHLALREPECAGGGKYEGRPHAFASAEYAVAHCLVKSSRHERRRRKARGERALHALAPGLELRTVCLESGSARGASLCDRILHGGLRRARHTSQGGLGAGSGPVSSSSVLRFATFTE